MGLVPSLLPSFLPSPVCLQGLLLLTLSVTLHSLRPPPCPTMVNCEPASTTQVSIFYFALYVIALGVGGMKPCLSALGGDQFNEDDDVERPMKRSFFNYWWLSIAGGGLVSLTMLVYVEDHVGFGWGYGIPTVGVWNRDSHLFLWHSSLPPQAPFWEPPHKSGASPRCCFSQLQCCCTVWWRK